MSDNYWLLTQFLFFFFPIFRRAWVDTFCSLIMATPTSPAQYPATILNFHTLGVNQQVFIRTAGGIDITVSGFLKKWIFPFEVRWSTHLFLKHQNLFTSNLSSYLIYNKDVKSQNSPHSVTPLTSCHNKADYKLLKSRHEMTRTSCHASNCAHVTKRNSCHAITTQNSITSNHATTDAHHVTYVTPSQHTASH